MRKTLAVAIALSLLTAPLWEGTAKARADSLAAAGHQEDSYYQPYTSEQLDNILAPIALYPDPLLAQVLLAATFADEIDVAARYVRAYGQSGIDDQPWDVSVKAVAHYPSVLYMMSDKLDWTTAVGQAYVNQSSDVMSSVQHLRGLAESQGNLVTSPQQQVVAEGGLIYIWPAQPQYIYVPVYDPYIVYYRRWPGYGPFFLGFGTGFVIGVWLNHDCDWRERRIYYTGWEGRGWVERSRAYVRINNNVYVNNRYTTININRTVINRRVNYNNLNQYNSVHRDARFDERIRGGQSYKPDARVNNRVINRNIETGDPRLERFRGRPTPPDRAMPIPQPPARPVEPRVTRPIRPAPSMPTVQPAPHAFGKTEGNFDPGAASQRGQSSRREANRPITPSQPGRPHGRPR